MHWKDVAKSKRILAQLRQAIQRLSGEDGDPILATHLHVRRHDPRTVQLGRYLLEKSQWGTYWILDAQDRSVLHSDLYSFHAAVAIIEHLNCGRGRRVADIVSVEEQYTRLVNELKHVDHVLELDPSRGDDLQAKQALLRERIHTVHEQLRGFRILQD